VGVAHRAIDPRKFRFPLTAGFAPFKIRSEVI
jgi:hypothetical protein